MLDFLNKLLFSSIPLEGGLSQSMGSFRAYLVIFIVFVTIFSISKIIKKEIVSSKIYKLFFIVAAIVGLSGFGEVIEFIINPSHEPYRFDLLLVHLVSTILWFAGHVWLITSIDKKGIKYSLMLFSLFAAFMFVGSALALHSNSQVFKTYFKRLDKTQEETSVSDAQRTSETLVAQIQGALERYRAVNGKYPETLEQLIPLELPEMLLVPSTNKPYMYELKADKSDYTIIATFEDGSVSKTNSPK